jgi:sugar lactone lactonase YvrE
VKSVSETVEHPLLRSDVRIFREARSIIAESLWSDATGDLNWCDIERGLLHSSALENPIDGTEDRVLHFAPPFTAFQPASDGGFVFAGESAISTCGRDGSNQTELARVEHVHDGMRLNEGKCDPSGRFVIGSMNFLGEDRDAAIYSVSADGGVRVLTDDIAVANGFEWSDDGSRMFFTDTGQKTVFVGDYSSDGELSHVEPFITGAEVDGLTRDAEGGFWAGIYGTGRLTRFDAAGGTDLELDVPAGHVTAVAFGGVDRSTLFIATAREKLTEAQLEDQPLTGSIFALDTATHGFPPHAFGIRT